VQSLRREGRLIINNGQFVLELREISSAGLPPHRDQHAGPVPVQAYDGKEGWRIDPLRPGPERMQPTT
jgi:hypothetical protein